MSKITLNFEQNGKLARITLQNPAFRNAITRQMWQRLPDLLQQATSARVLLICGHGNHFSAGADINQLADLQGQAAQAARFRQEMQFALDQLANFPAPSIAEIRGSCFGAGLAIAMACDLRFADTSAKICIPPAKLGLLYPQQDLTRLQKLIGPANAKKLLFSAEVIDANAAQQLGLVNSVGEASKTIKQILANSNSSLIALKSVFIGQDSNPDLTFDTAFDGTDFAEGLAAFADKRQPDYH